MHFVMFAPLAQLQVRDIVDILLITSLLYLAIVWVRHTRAVLVAGGILLLGVLYVLAVVFDLQLTIWILKSFFAALVIVVVVIFQEELRQFFERLAVWSLRRQKTIPQRSISDVLVWCLTDFSRDRIGALIVLPGEQPLRRHLDGGIELDGRVSIPLLKSLFDPHSPGHDGAVLIAGERIQRFAVHLPLSKNAAELAGLGTRHSAALGLAELSDAMCLVVSEERGTISIAHEGHLRRAVSPQEVGLAIEELVRPRKSAGKRSLSIVRLLRENWLEKVVSFLLVLALWYALVPGARVVQRQYSVPVQVIDLPADLELESIDPPDVEVTLRGPARAFYLFNQQQIAVTVDVTLAQFGRRTFDVSYQNVRHPEQLIVERTDPTTVKISVKKKPGTNGANGATAR
jgi:diadenylate cyclase